MSACWPVHMADVRMYDMLPVDFPFCVARFSARLKIPWMLRRTALCKERPGAGEGNKEDLIFSTRRPTGKPAPGHLGSSMV